MERDTYNMAGEVGTGTGFGRTVLICAGVCSLVATLLTAVTTFLQMKNYRKPLLQRHVIRIFMMVPIFAGASWASLTSIRAAFWIDPFRDVYEAFTLYTFFQLLVNFLGGERSLIIMMHGRAPMEHLWPLNHVLPKVDISDPHTFLTIKRGVLQYAYIKPLLAIATLVMKATGTFKDGKLALDSGYMWTSIIYNLSISWSLYDLALFWVCMAEDLQGFRPMPKFLCIKGIIFASWWQGFFLSILVWLGAIPSLGGGYTADNLAVAIQDALICFEMPIAAASHWYAFSWRDYADDTISDARMPIRYAIRDAFGPRDLIEDAKETFSGKKYDYRYFDAEDNVMAHEESASTRKRMREGMRYERDGRGKYWIPGPGATDSKQPLLGRSSHTRTSTMGSDASGNRSSGGYGTRGGVDEPELDPEEEQIYVNARALEFGDWNYPVINTHYATRKDRMETEPNIITASSNRALLQPTKENKQRRKSRIQKIQDDVQQSHHRSDSSSSNRSGESLSTKGKGKATDHKLERHSSTDSKKSHSSQLVDLVVEDRQAALIERIRGHKEGGPGWNDIESHRHFVQAYKGADNKDDEAVEEVRQGFNPDKPQQQTSTESHTLDDPFAVGDDDDDEGGNEDQTGAEQPWARKNYSKDTASGDASPFEDERNAWSR